MVIEQPVSRTLTCCWEMGGGSTGNVPWGLGPREWGSLAGRPVTHFFQLVQAVLVFLRTADLKLDVWPGGG